MPAIGTLITFAPGTTILSADVNANFSTIRTAVNTYGLFVDVAATISAVYTHTGAAIFQGGVTLSGATPNLIVGGTLAVTGASTLTGNVSAAGTLAVTGTATLSSTLAVTGAITATGGVVGALTGNVTGNLTGNVTGNVTGSSGSTTGNAATATALATGRAINGVTFDGTIAITVPAAAGTLTGATLASGVTASSLTSLGTLTAALLFVDNTLDIGASGLTRPRTGYFGTSVIAPLLNNTGTTITLRGVTYTLPAADGTAGQVLQTSGGAVLSWAAASAGFISGSGTTGTLMKFTGATAAGNSVLVEAAGVISGATALSLGTTPATAGALRLPNATAINYRNLANSLDYVLISSNSSDNVLVGTSGSGLILGPASLVWPTVDGTAGQVLKTNGLGTLSWVAQSSGGVSGLTTGKIPQAASATTLSDSVISQSGTAITIGGNLTLSNAGTLTVPGAATLQSTLAVTGASTLTGNVSCGGTLTTTGLFTSSGNTLVSGTFTVGSTSSLNGGVTLGGASSDTITLTARFASALVPTASAAYNIGSEAGPLRWNNVYLAGAYFVSGVQVVGARVTGFSPTWNAVYASSKTASLGPLGTPASFAQCAAAVDITALGQMVHAMYDAMFSSAHGLIGA